MRAQGEDAARRARRACAFSPRMTSLQHLLDATVGSPRPSSRSYDPVRRTPPHSVLVPISRVELVQCQNSTNPLRRRVDTVGGVDTSGTIAPNVATTSEHGGAATASNGKRSRDEEDSSSQPPKVARSDQDVRVVANHCAQARYLVLRLPQADMCLCRRQRSPEH